MECHYKLTWLWGDGVGSLFVVTSSAYTCALCHGTCLSCLIYKIQQAHVRNLQYDCYITITVVKFQCYIQNENIFFIFLLISQVVFFLSLLVLYLLNLSNHTSFLMQHCLVRSILCCSFHSNMLATCREKWQWYLFGWGLIDHM
jgi:hypothetical protein